MAFEEKQIIELDVVDSTNNYAMRLIDGNTAHHGLTIVAKRQTDGKGQRGRVWIGKPDSSLLMTTIVHPGRLIEHQFVFNAAIAVAVADVLKTLDTDITVHIKWPNDIIVNDKKAGGILIENVLRGSNWSYSVIGLGLNVSHESFPDELPFATSLKIEARKDFDLTSIRDEIIDNILNFSKSYINESVIMNAYNGLLYKKGKKQIFTEGAERIELTIIKAKKDGTLEVQTQDGKIAAFRHGQVTWEYGQ